MRKEYNSEMDHIAKLIRDTGVIENEEELSKVVRKIQYHIEDMTYIPDDIWGTLIFDCYNYCVIFEYDSLLLDYIYIPIKAEVYKQYK